MGAGDPLRLFGFLNALLNGDCAGLLPGMADPAPGLDVAPNILPSLRFSGAQVEESVLDAVTASP